MPNMPFGMKITLHLVLYLLLCLVQSLSAQQQLMSVRTFDVTAGLSSAMTFDIVKDDYGFIWTSTRLGIDCFDGLNFKHYSLSKNDMRMADDGVTHVPCLSVDGSGSLGRAAKFPGVPFEVIAGHFGPAQASLVRTERRREATEHVVDVHLWCGALWREPG